MITPAVTTKDWSFKDCQDYLVELEMATSGAVMSLRLANNDFNSSQADHQITCLSNQAREVRILTLRLRQKHLDAALRGTSPSTQVHEGHDLRGAPQGTAPCRATGSEDPGGCPRFSGRLEILECSGTWAGMLVSVGRSQVYYGLDLSSTS